MTQILVASTFFQAMSLAAAIKSGQLGESERRILVVCKDVPVPETVSALSDSEFFKPIGELITEVRSWNNLIAPQHPAGWCPRADDALILGKLVERDWNLKPGEVTRIVVQSPAVNPARAVSAVFSKVPISVYSEGLMSYGPTRLQLPQSMSERISELLHVDLLPGLKPLMLREHDVASHPIPLKYFGDVLAEVATSAQHLLTAAQKPITAVFLGQYLAAIGLLTPEEEFALHRDMLTGLAAQGHQDIAYKPHPQAPPAATDGLFLAAADLGVRLQILGPELPAEIWLQHLRPTTVVGCFSTALITAKELYGMAARTVGTELLLERLAPYANSNRIPLVTIDSSIPRLDTGTLPHGAPLGRVLPSVAFSMQPQNHPELHEDTVTLLTEFPQLTSRYFHPKRLTAQRLPGGKRPRPAIRGITRLRKIRMAVIRRIKWFFGPVGE